MGERLALAGAVLPGNALSSIITSVGGRLFTDRLLEWIEAHRDVPFFARLHVFDPHSPFEPHPPYERMWMEPEVHVWPGGDRPDPMSLLLRKLQNTNIKSLL